MKTFINNLVPQLREKLESVFQSEGPQATFDQYTKTLPQTDFGPWKFPYQWGEDSELSAPIAKLASFMANDKSEQSGEYWTDYVQNTLVPLARDAAGADIRLYPLEYQLYGCELAYILSIAFPTWIPGDELIKQARKAIVNITDLFFDEAGMPLFSVMSNFRSFVASWVRLRILEEKTSVLLFPERERTVYEWLVRNLILLTNPDSTQRMGRNSSVTNPKAVQELYSAALSMDSDEDDTNQALLALPWISQAKARTVKGLLMTEPSTHSKWSHVAVMQNDWEWKLPNVTLTYSRDALDLNINLAGKRLTNGPWLTKLFVDENLIIPEDELKPTCWSCEDNHAYLELQIPLSDGVTLERTVCLLHEEELLLLSDMVTFDKPSDKPRKIDLKSSLFLNGEFTFTQKGESTEGFLSDGKNQYNVFPLALSEWTKKASGSLTAENGLLTYNVTATGNGFYAPLVIDLNPKRSKRPYTWRQLTVTETGGVRVTPDIASGIRLQLGDKQWLIYKSLVAPVPRAVLGCHLIYQTQFARFVNGEIERIVAVE